MAAIKPQATRKNTHKFVLMRYQDENGRDLIQEINLVTFTRSRFY